MSKLQKLRASFSKAGIDALFITSPVNRRYISGFTGTAGAVLISEKAALFITDFRYMEQGKNQAVGFNVIEHGRSLYETVQEKLQELGIKRLGFEKHDLSYAQYETISKAFSAELVPVDSLVEELRLIKTEEELLVMKQAAKIADDAYDYIQTKIKPGVREIEISNELEFFMRSQGASSSSFDIIVASGLRSALPHGVASDKIIQEGELVTLDYGAIFNGYCSDITRTLAVGEISDELKKIYDTVLEAQVRGVDGIKAGLTGREADALTRDYINEQGYGKYFGHSTGHGLGLEVHEQPALSARSETVLKPGMVVTVEPGIYIPGVGGCRIEDDIVITETGNERLTHAKKELIHL